MATTKQLKDVIDAALDLEWRVNHDYGSDKVIGYAREHDSSNANAEVASKAAHAMEAAGFKPEELRHSRKDARHWGVVFDKDQIARLKDELASPEHGGKVMASDFPPIKGGVEALQAKWKPNIKDTQKAIAFFDTQPERDKVVQDLLLNGVVRSEIEVFRAGREGAFAINVPIATLIDTFGEYVGINGVQEKKHVVPFAEKVRTKEDPFATTKKYTWNPYSQDETMAVAVIGKGTAVERIKEADAITAELEKIEGIRIERKEVAAKNGEGPVRQLIAAGPIALLHNNIEDFQIGAQINGHGRGGQARGRAARR
ncbi:MAG: hypothetical protein AB7L92_08040 [Alphaproteobacteria bacterium]